ncbi:MAG: DUF4843 domain-containing protein [Bacteroidales bacterium]|nr:DUF4843 domain-containing protein [Bacteroidales bacterium]
MKKFMYISAVLMTALVTACQERNPAPFIDMSGVYFNNTSGTMTVTDSLDLTFVYESGDVLEVPVRVQLVGRPSDEERPIDITVDSENAVEGEDYVLPSSAVIPPGAAFADYVVTLRRTAALKQQKKMIRLTIHPNAHFDIPVTHMVQLSDTVSTVDFRIYFSDMFTKAPAAWEENLVGEFTQQKFELICRVLDIEPDDFNDPNVITLAKLLYISAEMTAYVQGETERKAAGEPYDEDAFDKRTGEPLTFR